MNFVNEIIAWASSHPKITFGIGYVAMAAVNAMPEPGSKLSWETVYTWFFDTLHALLPKNRTSVVTITAPQQKEEK